MEEFDQDILKARLDAMAPPLESQQDERTPTKNTTSAEDMTHHPKQVQKTLQTLFNSLS